MSRAEESRERRLLQLEMALEASDKKSDGRFRPSRPVPTQRDGLNGSFAANGGTEAVMLSSICGGDGGGGGGGGETGTRSSANSTKQNGSTSSITYYVSGSE